MVMIVTKRITENDYSKKSSFQETQSLCGNKRIGLYQLAWDLSGEDDDDNDDSVDGNDDNVEDDCL